eukprot:9879204-Alexandrium_andersonii.AAC.1
MRTIATVIAAGLVPSLSLSISSTAASAHTVPELCCHCVDEITIAAAFVHIAMSTSLVQQDSCKFHALHTVATDCPPSPQISHLPHFSYFGFSSVES